MDSRSSLSTEPLNSLESDDGAASGDKRLRVQITEEDLLCVNGCGFYGTPQWKGRCSKCWRAYQLQQKRTQDFAKNKELLNFEKFEDRRKQSTESRSLTLKSLLRKSPSMSAGRTVESAYAGFSAQSQSTLPSPSSTPSRNRHVSEESELAKSRFSDFLKKSLPHSTASEISRQTRHAVEKIFEQQNISMDDLSNMVQHFYQTLADKMRHSSAFSAPGCVSVEEVMAEIEQFVCVRGYSALFGARAEEEIADLKLQGRIRSLHWVTSGFLETTLDFSQQSVRDKLDEAITEMIDMNSHQGAAEKLDCLMRCSQMIFAALKESRSGAPASADEYLPVLIYVLLKANPPLIQSNVKFISRFALPSRVMIGERAYYFTNLSCALQFVQNMNAESLKMPKEEFDAYTSGLQVPPLNEINCGCNQAVRSMEKSLSQVRDLLDRQRELSHQIDEFENRIERENEEFMSDIRDTVSEFPSMELRHLSEQIAVDEELTFSSCSLTSSGNSRTSSGDHDEDDDSAQVRGDADSSMKSKEASDADDTEEGETPSVAIAGDGDTAKL